MTRNLVRFGLYLVIGYSFFNGVASAQTPSKEYIRVNGRVVAIESTAAATICTSASSTLAFRGTGTATGTGVVNNGTVDANWKMVSNPSTYGGASSTEAIAFTSSYGGATANSKPINPIGSDAALPAGAYVFRQSLDLSCHNPATVSISGTVQADDNIQIYVNGKLQSAPPANWYTSVAFTISGGGSAFVQGWNQVDFVLTNIGDPGNNPSMLRVDVTGATATVDTASNGFKFELSSNPLGGNRNGNTAIAISSGTQAVSWAMEAPIQGSLNSAASTTVNYAGPGAVSTLTVGIVKATSTTGSPVRTAFFPVWMNPGVGSSVTISGTNTNLPPYTSRAFSAAISGVPVGQDTIRWSVVSVPASTSSNGLISTGTTCLAPPASMSYRAPSTIASSGNIVLKAESCSNPAVSSTISVAVAAASSVTLVISPRPASVASPYTFTHVISAADSSAVVWSVTPTAAGTISPTGIFTAAQGFSGNVTARVQSVENANAFDTLVFSVTPFTPSTEPLNFFSTGIQSVDSSGQLTFVPGNGMDLHWLTTSIVGDESFIVGPAPVYMIGQGIGDTTLARYASYAVGSIESRPQSAVSVHSQWIYLEGNDPNTVSITGSARMDDYGRIFVNDQLIYGNNSDANGYWGYMWYAYVNYSINSASGGNAAGKFVNGWNKIGFEIKNFPGCCTVGFGLEAATATVLRTTPKGAPQVRIVPTSSTLTTNQKTTVAAVLSNSGRHEQAINWTMSPGNLGTLTSIIGGNVAIFQAGAGSGTVTLTATSVPLSSQSASIQIQINPSQTDGSTFVSGSSTLLPSTLASAQSFNVTLAYQNTGTTTWAAGTYSVASDNGVNWGTNSASLASSIAPGAIAIFNLTLTAPTVASSQAVAFSWRLRNASNAFFGAIAGQNTTISPSNIQISLAPTGGQLGYGTTRNYTITATGFVAGQNRTINLSRVSTNSSYLGSLSATSVSISGTGSTGTATFSYVAQACGQFCASPAPVITITSTSAQDSSRTAVDQFTLVLPAQTLSSTMTSSGRQATFNITVADPNTDVQITWAEFVLSPQSTSNGLPAGEACRFRVSRTGGQFQAGLDNSSGGSNYIYGTFGGGILEHPGDPNPNACRILLGSSTGTAPDGKTWNITLKVENLKMSGIRYLRGQTFAGATSIPAPDSFLGPTWTLGSLPAISITNSQNVSLPVIAEGQSLDLYMQVANLCSGCKAKFRLVQQNEGSLSSVANPAGYSAQANFAATTNAGTDRDIFIVTTVYLNQTAWQNEDASQTDCNEDTCMASPYRIRVTSSFSSSNLPSFPNINPFVGSGPNPQPLNAIVTANGTTSHLIQFAVKNGPYEAITTNVNAIDEYYFNINRTFTQSGLAQDSAGACQLRFAIFTGGASKNYFLYLKGDSGSSDVGSIFGSLPETATGVLSNSQCKVEIGSGIGTYAQTASDPTVLGFGIKVTFFSPFSGERYVFMQSNRVNNGWTGWQYRGTMNMQ